MTDTTWLDGTAQAQLVQSGQASPAELVGFVVLGRTNVPSSARP